MQKTAVRCKKILCYGFTTFFLYLLVNIPDNGYNNTIDNTGETPDTSTQLCEGNFMEYYENEQKAQRAFLISVDDGTFDAESSMNELYALAESAGAEPAGSFIQKLEKPVSATYIGSGRLEELCEICSAQEIDLIIADCELTPNQLRNIEDAADVRVIDRTMLILDIFALRANSKEGKLQVEIAQLRYMLPRLTGKGVQMSRLGGGIGTRGPGETKLETDKRHIRRKIDAIAEQLSEIERHREQLRKINTYELPYGRRRSGKRPAFRNA